MLGGQYNNIFVAERQRKPTIKAQEAAEQGRSSKGKEKEHDTSIPNQRRKNNQKGIDGKFFVFVCYLRLINLHHSNFKTVLA